MKKLYVCGFLFDPKLKHVALIRKNKPEWQRGKLNGIGGKVEESDVNVLGAMIREFKEEAGLDIREWHQLFNLHGPDYIVIFFKATSQDIDSVKSLTDEIVEVHDVDDINDLNVIPNLKWLIPMAIDESLMGSMGNYVY